MTSIRGVRSADISWLVLTRGFTLGPESVSVSVAFYKVVASHILQTHFKICKDTVH